MVFHFVKATILSLFLLGLANGFPGALYITPAAVVCPHGTRARVVTSDWGGSSIGSGGRLGGGGGGQSLHWGMFCLDSAGVGKEPSDILVQLVAWLELFVAANVIALAIPFPKKKKVTTPMPKEAS